MKPGRWRERGGGVASVETLAIDRSPYTVWGRGSDGCRSVWRANGRLLRQESQYDLVEFLGPLEDEYNNGW